MIPTTGWELGVWNKKIGSYLLKLLLKSRWEPGKSRDLIIRYLIPSSFLSLLYKYMLWNLWQCCVHTLLVDRTRRNTDKIWLTFVLHRYRTATASTVSAVCQIWVRCLCERLFSRCPRDCWGWKACKCEKWRAREFTTGLTVAIGEFVWGRGAGVSDVTASATSSKNWLRFGRHIEVSCGYWSMERLRWNNR